MNRDSEKDMITYGITPPRSYNYRTQQALAEHIPRRLKSSLILASLLLIGCQGGLETTSNKTSNQENDNSPLIASNLEINVLKDSPYTGKLLVQQSDDRELTFHLIDQPRNGVVSITNARKGLFRLLTNSDEVDHFTYFITDGDLSSNAATVEIRIDGSDPLLKDQWYLRNTGQTAYSDEAGNPAEDIRLLSLHDEGVTGEGVVVALIDEGLEIKHQDLAENVLSGGSYNFLDGGTDPENFSTRGDHGTSVAGLISAVAGNGLGIRGVAPDASIRAFNFLASDQVIEKLLAVNGLVSSQFPLDLSNVDIVNKSYGLNPTRDTAIDPLLESTLIHGVTNLRNGKGIIYVKAAGNEFENCENNIRLTCYNTNMEPDNTVPWQIIVGATTAHGSKASYSNTGSSLFISAPGGEDGIDEPAIVTTDQSGCQRGFGVTHPDNSFEVGHELNTQCSYTSLFGGTSASTPLVSGVIALMLQVNPALNWRDVKHILLSTARKIDPDHPGIKLRFETEEYIAEYPWLTNAAGYSFHNWYGFGIVHAADAVRASRNYTHYLKPLVTTDWVGSENLNFNIPDNNPNGVNYTISITETINIEAVQIKLSAEHGYIGDLGITLTSPAGMKSVLLNTDNGFTFDDDFEDYVMLSNAFYGENSRGDWTINVMDGQENDNGVLKKVEIRFYGHNK